MFTGESAIYLNKTEGGGYLGFIAENCLYFVLEVEQGLESELGDRFLEAIKKNIALADIYNLSSFESYIGNEIRKFNLPSEFSLSAGILIDGIFYLRTIGDSKIYLKRGRQFVKLIEGTSSASGYVDKDDIYVFAGKEFNITSYKEETIIQVMEHDRINDVVESLKSRFPYQTSQNVVALFVKLDEKKQIGNDDRTNGSLQEFDNGQNSKRTQPLSRVNKFKDNLINAYGNLRLKMQTTGKRKIFTVLAIVIVFAILFWSVIMGKSRKENAEATRKLEVTEQLVIQKLDQAEDISFLNLARSMALVNEAKQEVEKLKSELGGKKSQEIKELMDLVISRENNVVKKEEKNYEEFFDLTLDSEKAKGEKVSLDGDGLTILDSGNGVIYSLSLSKKSLDKINNNNLRNASLISSFASEKYFFVKEKGVYKLNRDSKIEKVIDNDEEWGNIADMSIYNGNIYLMDNEKDEVYKYLVLDEGYSDKKSYFGSGESIDLENANSITIDSSLYIGFPDYVKKFTAGVKDKFETSYPEEDIALIKVFTNKDLGKVYGWSKDKGAIYILEKDGAYEKQINSEVFKKASDFVVFDNNIYALVESKIFKINID